eukprot:g33115.t1
MNHDSSRQLARVLRTRTTTLDNAEMEAMMLQEELEEMEAERAAKDLAGAMLLFSRVSCGERHLQMSQKAVPWVETQFFAMLMAAVVLANSVVIGCPVCFCACAWTLEDFGTWDEGEKQKKVEHEHESCILAGHGVKPDPHSGRLPFAAEPAPNRAPPGTAAAVALAANAEATPQSAPAASRESELKKSWTESVMLADTGVAMPAAQDPEAARAGVERCPERSPPPVLRTGSLTDLCGSLTEGESDQPSEATPKAARFSQQLEMELERADVNEDWGFCWRPRKRRWILESLKTNSVASAWNERQRELGLKSLELRSTLLEANGSDQTPGAAKCLIQQELNEALRLRLIFLLPDLSLQEAEFDRSSAIRKLECKVKNSFLEVSAVDSQDERRNFSDPGTNPMVNFEPFMSFDNREYFGNIVRSFLSMIQVITNAQWANHIGRPIILQYPALFVFFAFFLLSTTFGLVTCIVANIVQDTVLRWVQLTQSDLDRALENEEFVQILRLLEVPVMSSENLMRLFDLNGRGHVSFQELVQGITSMLEDAFPRAVRVGPAQDIDPKDYTKLALWSDSLMKRMEACEQRCHVLAQQVVDLRRQMKECFNCLALFIGSRENTELYYRALKAIRSAPPPMPVDIREALGLEIKEEKVLEDEAAALMNFARRYVAAGPPTGCRDVTRATVT